MATATDLLTIAEYLALPDAGAPTELVRGRIVEHPFHEPIHGLVNNRVACILGDYVRGRGLGELTIGSGVITLRDPDSLRGADVAYYPATKLPPTDAWPTYLDVPPDLVLEVRSIHDRWADLLTKAAEYLAAGVLVVVLLDPDARTATVLVADLPPRTLGPGDLLTLPAILGDFAARVDDIFA